MRKLNLILAGNDRVFPGMELVIYSTLTHNKGIDWYIFTMDLTIERPDGELIQCQEFRGLSTEQREQLQRIVAYLDPTSSITFLDLSELYEEYFKGNPNEWSGFTPYMFLRLLADKALPYLDDALYLDCDTAVQGDIRGMYEHYIQLGHPYYAYITPDACEYAGEMVSGVMLMDFKVMRRIGFLDRAIENVWSQVYIYPDQDALRDAGKCYPLPETYGFIDDLWKCPYQPIILHFTNKLSPKIYCEEGKIYFYRKYPFLRYVQEGLEKMARSHFEVGAAEEED